MTYSYGDSLSVKLPNNQYLALFIAGKLGEDQYMLAFFDYQSNEPPTAEALTQYPLHIQQLDMGSQKIVMLYCAIMPGEALENSPAITFLTHIEMPGTLGSNGLIPVHEPEDIAAFYEQQIKSAMPPEVSPDLAFFPRALMTIAELKPFITPTNPFPTVKFYKTENDQLLYWQIYGSPDPLGVVHCWGVVGERGKFEEFIDKDLPTLQAIYQKKVDEKRNAGYREYEDDDEKQMILQFQTSDSWGSNADLNYRNEMEDYLNPYLFWTGNGAFSGGDIGSGTINLFFEVLHPLLALKTILMALEKKKVDQPFIIALETDEGYKTIYPSDHSGEDFHLV